MKKQQPDHLPKRADQPPVETPSGEAECNAWEVSSGGKTPYLQPPRHATPSLQNRLANAQFRMLLSIPTMFAS